MGEKVIRFKLLYIRDKAVYQEKKGLLGYLGNALKVIKELSREYQGFHLIDLNLKNRNMHNFNIFDEITTFSYLQIDGKRNLEEHEIKRLYEINARVLFYPKEKEIEKLKGVIKKSFSLLYVNQLNKDNDDMLKLFKDVLIEKKELIPYLEKNKKRIFFAGTKKKVEEIDEKTRKKIFCWIEK